MTVNNQNNGPKVFTSKQAQSASVGEMKSLKVDTPVFRTVLDMSAASQVRQGLATGLAYATQGAATVFGAMGMNQVAAMASTAGAKMAQIGQMGDKPVMMTTQIKTLGTPMMQANGGQQGMGGLAMGQQAGQASGQPGGQQPGGSPFGGYIMTDSVLADVEDQRFARGPTRIEASQAASSLALQFFGVTAD